MTEQRTLSEAWQEVLPQLDIYYPSRCIEFRQLTPVFYDGDELILSSDIPFIVDLFSHPNWWLGVGDHINFIFQAGKRIKFTVVLTDNVSSVR